MLASVYLAGARDSAWECACYRWVSCLLVSACVLCVYAGDRKRELCRESSLCAAPSLFRLRYYLTGLLLGWVGFSFPSLGCVQIPAYACGLRAKHVFAMCCSCELASLTADAGDQYLGPECRERFARSCGQLSLHEDGAWRTHAACEMLQGTLHLGLHLGCERGTSLPSSPACTCEPVFQLVFVCDSFLAVEEAWWCMGHGLQCSKASLVSKSFSCVAYATRNVAKV